MFDVKKHLIKVQGGRQYLPVSARLVWFREEHPDWGIETKSVIIDTEKQFAIFEATVYDAAGKLMAKGTKMEDVRGFHDYVEKSETGAIGRALAVCGFGTQFAPDLDEMDANRFVDSPQPIRGAAGYDNGRSQPERPSNPPAVGYRPGPAPSRPEPIEPRRDYKPEGAGDDNRWKSQIAPPNGVAAASGAHSHAPASVASPTGSANATEHTCTACGRDLNASQESLSLRKYGIALCPVCQKERHAVEAAG